ncbi:hypothetical protein [Pseudovibrio sp. Tun.PSC04-5.I4]|uniref:hypothetical protein n=1 Tax=Pseudovibrio sp. Tun.PSC04-5.I4 TaxID=1798213 RepID=UPI00117B8DC0|nr:hypothetical protein [Pseudovibrio sp. Tun.PSC04-5.I4]
MKYTSSKTALLGIHGTGLELAFSGGRYDCLGGQLSLTSSEGELVLHKKCLGKACQLMPKTHYLPNAQAPPARLATPVPGFPNFNTTGYASW